MMVEIPDELAQWLLESANQRGISIKNLLTELLVEKQTAACIEASEDGAKVPGVEPATAIEGLRDELEREYPPGSLGRFAQLALKSGLASEEFVDTSARSREILTAEFADHIDRRIRQ
ncbi:MAG: hypothetical protein OXG53_06050 [Chloroflexi bacterium]|nr:hypothetical protein [Chloroflexota bacterium]